MRVIVVGAGKLGYEVARLLSAEDHDIVVVDQREDALSEVANSLDVLSIQGNGASPKVLAKAGVDKTDLLIAAAGPDEVNIVACLTAKQRGVPVCAARVRNADYLSDDNPAFTHMRFGIDVVVNPERTAALEITRILKTPTATQVAYFAGGRVSLIGLKVDGGAPIVRGPLREIQPQRCVVAAVVRDDKILIPDGDTVVRPGDKIYLAGRTGNFAEIRALMGSSARSMRDVVIVGGGRIGLPLAQMLASGQRRGMEVKVIERSPERCAELAAALPGVLVICGDAEKLEVLREEMVGGADAFVAATGDDATNLLSTMAAKQLGVGQAIVALSREDYIPLAERAGADATVVPRLITASTLLQLANRYKVESLSLFEEGRAEAVELVVEAGSRAEGKRLMDLGRLPGAIVGAVVRRDEVIIPKGQTVVKAGDHLVLFGTVEALERIQRMFRG
ncbi:MAG: Trk system potassium transporter TrkA [Firmicutes bacterium]|nr:Trk system potassium transporter TrkA [Bacillota bacterium]